MNCPNVMSLKSSYTILSLGAMAVLLALLWTSAAQAVTQGSAAGSHQVKIAILMVNDARQETLQGFKDQMEEYLKVNGGAQEHIIRNAEGDRKRLPELAAQLVAAKPNLAIACGGIEADALKIATAGTDIPVIFLAASSVVERGLVDSMARPGGNVTGVDTNDTALVEKRLWFIHKMFPKARRVLVFSVPDIPPSVKSVALARQRAPQLGLELQVVEVRTREEIATAVAKVKRSDTDVVLLLPLAPTDNAVKEIMLPHFMTEKIPIFGYNEGGIKDGAMASYGSSRHSCGQQAARLAIKVLRGAAPAELPVETPDELNLVINRGLVKQLDVSFSKRIWRLAEVVVDLSPHLESADE